MHAAPESKERPKTKVTYDVTRAENRIRTFDLVDNSTDGDESNHNRGSDDDISTINVHI